MAWTMKKFKRRRNEQAFTSQLSPSRKSVRGRSADMPADYASTRRRTLHASVEQRSIFRPGGIQHLHKILTVGKQDVE